MGSIKVYGPPMSTAVSRVLACLLEKEVDFQLLPIDLSKRQHKSPDFLKLQLRAVGVCTSLIRIKMERMGSVKVFGLPASTDVARVLVCLFEKDVEFQLIRTDTYKGEHKVPEFLRLQDPSGQATFKQGELTLTDSREICRYIVKNYADSGNKVLLGTGALERASIEQWLLAEAENFEVPSSLLVFQLAFAVPMAINPEQALIEKNERQLSKVLDVYDKRLGESEYLAGDEFSLADLSHLPNSHYLINKSERGQRLFFMRKNVYRWWKAISARPAWKKVVQMQSEYPGPLENSE